MANIQELMSQLDGKVYARNTSYAAATQLLAGKGGNALDALHAWTALADGIYAKVMDNAAKDAAEDEEENGTQE